MSMFGKHCRECGKPVSNMDYCDKHFDEDKMIGIFKKSCEKHLKKFDKQKKQHQKRNFVADFFDNMHNISTKVIKQR